MKVYILFKVKDMKKKKKEWIIDNVYTSYWAARKRSMRLHGIKSLTALHEIYDNWKHAHVSKVQYTYFINKSLKGQIKINKK